MYQPSDNPYRSPSVESYDETHQEEESLSPKNVWRWRHVLILCREEVVLPQACVRTNLSGGLFMCPLTAITSTGILLCFLVFSIPAIGWLISLVLAGNKSLGFTVQFRLPIRRSVAAIMVLTELFVFGLQIFGNSLSAYGLFQGEHMLAVLGVALSLIAFFIFWASDRWYLRTDIIEPNYIAVRGVHPDYLDRLPEFPKSANPNLLSIL